MASLKVSIDKEDLVMAKKAALAMQNGKYNGCMKTAEVDYNQKDVEIIF